MNDLKKPQTVRHLLQWAADFLGKEKRIEGELILAHLCQFSRAKLLAHQDHIPSEEIKKDFINLVNLRKKGEPLQYITGLQNFMGLDFKVNRDVLIPRSDTEILVEEVIKLAKALNKPLKILDLCTGSGAIAVSLAKFIPQVEVVATDISKAALKVALFNAEKHQVQQKVTFLQGDLFEPLENNLFDIIVSNPPYISSKEMEELPSDVKKEPFIALWGGDDGLEFYRKIVPKGYEFLKKKGYLFLEIGFQQALSLKNLCLKNGFKECLIIKDWAERDRVVKAYKNI